MCRQISLSVSIRYYLNYSSDSGSVYTIGVNRFGQLGQPNMNTTRSGVPVKLEFPKDIKIAQIKIGDSHNLMMTKEGELYSNGDNSTGQIDGELDNFLYYHCTPKRINLPDSSPIKKIFAQSNRSAAILENGKSYYWGGFAYEPKCKFNKLPRYDGINLFNEEKGMPENSKISEIGLGYLHDIILV
jgi:alpha-tubulin suppressor-like RCC1 family protein